MITSDAILMPSGQRLTRHDLKFATSDTLMRLGRRFQAELDRRDRLGEPILTHDVQRLDQ